MLPAAIVHLQLFRTVTCNSRTELVQECNIKLMSYMTEIAKPRSFGQVSALLRCVPFTYQSEARRQQNNVDCDQYLQKQMLSKTQLQSFSRMYTCACWSRDNHECECSMRESGQHMARHSLLKHRGSRQSPTHIFNQEARALQVWRLSKLFDARTNAGAREALDGRLGLHGPVRSRQLHTGLMGQHIAAGQHGAGVRNWCLSFTCWNIFEPRCRSLNSDQRSMDVDAECRAACMLTVTLHGRPRWSLRRARGLVAPRTSFI